MARYGFPGGETAMKFVLLYTLRHSLFRPNREELTEVAFLDDNMDYFQFCDALDALVQGRQVALSEDARYEITEQGAQNADIIASEVPAALRAAIDAQIAPRNERARRDSCLHTETLTRRGEHYALLSLSDGHRPILKLEILAAGKEQAEQLCAKFRKDAESIYGEIWSIMEKHSL